MENDMLGKAADNIRILSAAMVEKAGSGHPGGAMGGADFISVLFSEFLSYDPADPHWVNRDRFFLDPGHMSPMLYSILLLIGRLSMEDIRNFRQWGSNTPGHPELNVARGIENTSGPLGQGHAMALGAAIAERFFASRFGEWLAHKTYAYISDGGIQEEISQGVGRIAGHLGLSNFIMFYDSNSVQLSTPTSKTTSEDTARKYEAWGWRVEIIPGNDSVRIRDALARANAETLRPTLIIGLTSMAKCALNDKGESFEGRSETHGTPLSKAGASMEKTIKNCGGHPLNPFSIFDDVKQYFSSVRVRKSAGGRAKRDLQARWEKENPALSEKFRRFWSGAVPTVAYDTIEHKANAATRVASSNVLFTFAKQVENMIVASADLCNSDNTDGFLKGGSRIFTKGDFGGGFMQAGVSELTMAEIMNGIALHGGIIPVCGTFFVFSDFMKPAVRLAALMNLPVKYVWTHDSFRVGEDGPTHEPIEHEAQIRLLESMKNLDGKRSMLVLRPADAAETSMAWKIAMENTQAPTGLLLSRQSMPDLPASGGKRRFADAAGAGRGGYTVFETGGTVQLVCVANGSEVATLIGAARTFSAERGLAIRVVSMISQGLFFEQPLDYRETVMPFGVPVFGLTSGVPATLCAVVGAFGGVYGMERFGASAPFQVLEDKFGFTQEAVVEKMAAFLDNHKRFLVRLAGTLKI